MSSPTPDSPSRPAGAVFLSYAREDAEAARRIADALRAFGVEVWFDENELRGGDAWDQKIRRQIKECALFLSVISARTQARGEGYFRFEWKLAVERTHLMAEGLPFLAPIVIDDTPEAGAVVPVEFMRVQWTRLPGALPTPQFVEQTKRLLEAPRAPVGITRPLPAAPAPEVGRRVPVAGWAGVLALAVIAGSVIYFTTRKPEPPSNVLSSSNGPTTGKSVADAKPATPTLPADKSIAVLPFENRSDDKDGNAFFADGVHEDILTNLALVRDLRVVSRTSVTSYRGTTKRIPEIARELGVAYLLEGSVQRSGTKVRVTGQLIRAATDEHVWAKSYDRDLTDIFAVQSELAQAIAQALSAALSPQEKSSLARRPTENVAAYELYLKARERRSDNSQQSAIALLQQAVELDPKFAVAWAELGDRHARTVFLDFDHTPQRLAAARAAIDTAVRLAPDDPGVIAKLGAYYYHSDRYYARATEQYVRLAQMRPNDPEVPRALSGIQARQGRYTDAVGNARRALELDPGNLGGALNLFALLENGRRHDEAEALARRLIKAFPEEEEGYFGLALIAYEARGSTVETDDFARHAFAPARRSRADYLRKILARLRGDTTEAMTLDRGQPVLANGVVTPWAQEMEAAITLANAGDLTAARLRATAALAVMNEEKEKQPTNSWLFAWLGQAHALLGHKTEALACAQRSLELLPESRDAIYGVQNAVMAASVYAWVGEKDRALAEFDRLLKIPNGTNIVTAPRGANDRHTQASFKPLFDDPHFQALVADPKNNAPLF